MGLPSRARPRWAGFCSCSPPALTACASSARLTAWEWAVWVRLAPNVPIQVEELGRLATNVRVGRGLTRDQLLAAQGGEDLDRRLGAVERVEVQPWDARLDQLRALRDAVAHAEGADLLVI